jgi:hypothetical protein
MCARERDEVVAGLLHMRWQWETQNFFTCLHTISVVLVLAVIFSTVLVLYQFPCTIFSSMRPVGSCTAY